MMLLPGDMFDGSKIDPLRVAAPLLELKPPLGIYFVGGNHEQFGGAAHFEKALRAGGIRVLHNECADVDGLRVVGVAYGHSTYPLQMGSFLEGLRLKDGPASILLNHVPNRLPLAEHAGVSLQLSQAPPTVAAKCSRSTSSPAEPSENLPTACSSSVRCRCTRQAVPGRGVPRYGWARTPRSSCSPSRRRVFIILPLQETD